MELSREVMERQLGQIQQLHEKAAQESAVLDQVEEERKRTLSLLVGDTWKARTLREDSHVDPLLSKKFRTKAAHSGIRLEKLLLDLDKVDTFGNADLRARRKDEVKYIQQLLTRADEMNKKALKLVEFQEHLAVVGKTTLRTSFEAPENNTAAEENDIRGLRKRALDQTVPLEANKEDRASDEGTDDEGQMSISPRHMDKDEEETPVPRAQGGGDTYMTHSDSVDDLLAAERDMNRRAEEYYRSIHKAQKKASTPKKTPEQNQKEQPTDEEKAGGKPKTPKQHQARHQESQRQEEPELAQPKVTIQEAPRAYIMYVQDANARRARVSLNEESVLTILVPGRAPAQFSLGSNINLNAITKELVQGNTLRIVLPKTPSFPMRTGRGFGDAAPLWGRRHDDLWSRF